MMPAKWSTISLDPRYELLSQDDKLKVQDTYWNRVVVADPRYQSRTPEEQAQIRAGFDASIRDRPQGTRAVGDDPGAINSRMDYLRRVYIEERQGLAPNKDKNFNELPKEFQHEFLQEFDARYVNMSDDFQSRILDRFAQDWKEHLEVLEQERDAVFVSAERAPDTAGLPTDAEPGIPIPIKPVAADKAIVLPVGGEPYNRQREWARYNWTEAAYYTVLEQETGYTGLSRTDPGRPPPELEEERSVGGELAASVASGALLTGAKIFSTVGMIENLVDPIPQIAPDETVIFGRRHIGKEAAQFYNEMAETSPFTRRVGMLRTKRSFGENFWSARWWMRSLGETGPQIVGSVALATQAGPVYAFTFMASLEAGAQYETAIAAGASEKAAMTEAFVVGTINGLLEMIPISRLAGKLKGVGISSLKSQGFKKTLTTILRESVIQAGEEGFTEGLQEVVSIIAGKLGHDDRATFEENVRRVLESTVIGGAMGFGMGGSVQTIVGLRTVQERNNARAEAAQTLGVNKDATPQEIEARYQAILREEAGLPPEAAPEEGAPEVPAEAEAPTEAAPAPPVAPSTEEQVQRIVEATVARDLLLEGKGPAEEIEVMEPMRTKTIARTREEITSSLKWYREITEKGAPVTLSIERFFDYVERHEARGARVGYRAGQLDLIATHQEIIEYAEEHLPPAESKLVKMVLKREQISTKTLKKILVTRTPSEVKRVIQSINKMTANYERASAVAEYQDAMKRVKKTLKARKIKLRPEFQARLDELTDSFKLSETRESTKKKFESILAAAKLDKIGEIPEKLITRAREVLSQEDKPLLRKMEPNEIRAITIAALNIVNENILKTQTLHAAEHRDYEKALAESVAALDHIHGSNITEVIPRGLVAKIVKEPNVSHDTRVDHIAGEEGAGYDILYNNLQDSNSDYIALRQHGRDILSEALKAQGISLKVLKQWSAAVRGKKVGDTNMVTIVLPEAVDEQGARVENVTLTVGERIELLNFLEDPMNRAEILRNKQKGFTLDRDPLLQPIIIKAADIQAIRDSASPEEKAIAKAMFQYINGPLRASVNQTSMLRFGFELWPRENYYQRRRDKEFSTTEPDEMNRNFRQSMLDNLGIFKPRDPSNEPFRIGDAFKTYNRLTAQASSYAAKSLAIHDAARLLNDRRFRQQVLKSVKHGEDVLRDLENSVRVYTGLDVVEVSDVERLTKAFIRRAHIATLAFRPAIIIYQKISLFNALTEIEAKYLAGALVPSPRQTKAEIQAYSAALWARTSSMGHQLLTPGTDSTSLAEFYVPDHATVESILMSPIVASDAGIIHIIWRAARAKMIDQGFTGDELMQKTAELAEQITNRTQPTWDSLTISKLAESGKRAVMLRLAATMFTSAINKNVNISIRGWHRFQRAKKRPGGRTLADYNALAKSITIPLIVNPLAVYAIGQGVGKGWELAWGIDREEEEPEKIWLRHVLGFINRATGQQLIVGDVMGEVYAIALRTVLNQPGRVAEIHRNLLAGAVTDGLYALTDFGQMLNAHFRDGDDDRALVEIIEMVEHGANPVGIVFKFPVRGVLKPLKPGLREKKKELKRPRR